MATTRAFLRRKTDKTTIVAQAGRGRGHLGRIAALALVGCVGAASGSLAGDLVYTPINPSFGGSPLNSAHLLGIAAAQRNATASDYVAPVAVAPTTTAATSDADLFVRQLQGRLLSALANQVSDAIFGDNPQDSGTVQFGGTTISFDRSIGSIRLVITDATAGTTTEIVVPQLVTSGGAGASTTSSNVSSTTLMSSPAASPLTIN